MITSFIQNLQMYIIINILYLVNNLNLKIFGQDLNKNIHLVQISFEETYFFNTIINGYSFIKDI